MVFKRNLKFGMSGIDVRYVKEKLFSAGFYGRSVSAIRKDSFGLDTLAAVRSFQRANADDSGTALRVDGIVGVKTWGALERYTSLVTDLELPENVGSVARQAIATALLTVSSARRSLVLDALQYAYDPRVPRRYPRSLYIWGGNLYNTDLERNVITSARIEAGTKRTPQYYDGGRREMMKAAVAADPEITGADCSGGIVGLMRRHGLVKPSFDATADALCGGSHSTALAEGELRPGDWVGRSRHIGLYAGGGYVVEWMGGAFGCQLNLLTDRKGYDFVTGRLRARPDWTRYRRPRAY